MTNRVAYEWVAEYVDEHADIVDHAYADAGQLDVLLNQYVEKHPTLRIEFAVQRFEIHELDGVVDRSYAYFDNDGVLEEYTCQGIRVPAYVRKEAERHAERVRQLTDYME